MNEFLNALLLISIGIAKLVGFLILLGLAVLFVALLYVCLDEHKTNTHQRHLREFLAKNPIPAVYLKRKDVENIVHFMHFIPMGRGWSQRLITENYPGWNWNTMVTMLRIADAFELPAGPDGPVAGNWEGVLLDGEGGFELDHGDLQHPAKSAWREPVSPSTDVTAAGPVAAIDLATGLELPVRTTQARNE
ncbi:MAG: hypothetical protein ACKOW9_05705 [Candidatus Paceibacterota bacterium]